jgi:hypothetical protein
MFLHGPRWWTSSALNNELKASSRALVGVAAGADRGDRAGLGQLLGVPNGKVLPAAVGVMNETVDGLPGVRAGPDAHLHEVDEERQVDLFGSLKLALEGCLHRDPCDGNPEHLDAATQNLLSDLAQWSVRPHPGR